MSNIINAVCECCGLETLCHVETSPEMLSICETCMAEEYDDREFDDAEFDDYDDSMDGDHDSTMTSIGWGTDEDYGYDGMDYDFGMDG